MWWIVERSVQGFVGDEIQPVKHHPQLASGDTAEGVQYRLVCWAQYLRNYPEQAELEREEIEPLQRALDVVALNVSAIGYHLRSPQAAAPINYPTDFDRWIGSDILDWALDHADDISRRAYLGSKA